MCSETLTIKSTFTNNSQCLCVFKLYMKWIKNLVNANKKIKKGLISNGKSGIAKPNATEWLQCSSWNISPNHHSLRRPKIGHIHKIVILTPTIDISWQAILVLSFKSNFKIILKQFCSKTDQWKSWDTYIYVWRIKPILKYKHMIGILGLRY